MSEFVALDVLTPDFAWSIACLQAYEVGRINRKPALIVRCAGAADVIHAVSFASAHGLLTSVRGGGHSLSGQSVCDGGLEIDLAPMRSVHIDPAAKTARVEPGTLIGQFDREAQAFDLARPPAPPPTRGSQDSRSAAGSAALARSTD